MKAKFRGLAAYLELALSVSCIRLNLCSHRGCRVVSAWYSTMAALLPEVFPFTHAQSDFHSHSALTCLFMCTCVSLYPISGLLRSGIVVRVSFYHPQLLAQSLAHMPVPNWILLMQAWVKLMRILGSQVLVGETVAPATKEWSAREKSTSFRS